MPDLKPATHLLFLREEDLDGSLELLYYAARDLAVVPESPLAEQSLGQAHHRVLSFVARHPGISVGELLGMLRMTKQSLSRLLIEMQRADLVQQRPAGQDRRRRILSLTTKGADLERQLSRHLRARLARAYRDAGGPAVEGFRQVLRRIVSPEDRRRAERTAQDAAGEPAEAATRASADGRSRLRS